MEGETDVERLRERLRQENLLREIRGAILDMQGQLKERSRLCRDRCAKLLKVHQRIEEEMITGQDGLFEVGALLSDDLKQLINAPSIE